MRPVLAIVDHLLFALLRGFQPFSELLSERELC